MKTHIILPLLVIALSACATTSKTQIQYIQVFKSDGSVQCQHNSGISVKNMQTQLSGIKVYAAKKYSRPDVAYPAVCGGATGYINIYTIAHDDLNTALERGFQPLPQHLR